MKSLPMSTDEQIAAVASLILATQQFTGQNLYISPDNLTQEATAACRASMAAIALTGPVAMITLAEQVAADLQPE